MSSDNPIAGLDGVSFSYSKRDFMKDLSLGIKEGAFIGLLGANGSGKSTMLKLLCGILKPARGTVNLWGRPLQSLTNKDRAKLISYLPQVLDIGVPFTVRELAEMGLYPYEGSATPGQKGFATPIDEALEMVGLREKKDAPITNLSGGERRRAFIAMTLVQGAGIVLLDEPLANLDIKYQIELIRLLKELNAKKNITVVMALHDINLALRFDRLIVVKEGRLLGDGMPREMLTEALLKEAFGANLRIMGNGDEVFIGYEQ